MSVSIQTPPTGAPRIFQRDGRPLIRARDLVGLKRSTFSDLYYFLIASRWRVVLLIYGGGYLLTNALFAFVYTWTGGVTNVRPGSYSDAFFFSAETLGTIGYGVFAPQSFAAHSVATVENMVGLLFLATFTGITFAKFSRPRARVIFSDVAVVGERNGTPTLSFRVRERTGEPRRGATLQGDPGALGGDARGRAVSKDGGHAAGPEREPGLRAHLARAPRHRRDEPAPRA